MNVDQALQAKLVGMAQSAYLQGWSDAAKQVREMADETEGLDLIPGGRELLLALADALVAPKAAVRH